MNGPAALPQELLDHIVDALAAEGDNTSLKRCALTSRAFLSRTSAHLFRHIRLARYHANKAESFSLSPTALHAVKDLVLDYTPFLAFSRRRTRPADPVITKDFPENLAPFTGLHTLTIASVRSPPDSLLHSIIHDPFPHTLHSLRLIGIHFPALQDLCSLITTLRPRQLFLLRVTFNTRTVDASALQHTWERLEMLRLQIDFSHFNVPSLLDFISSDSKAISFPALRTVNFWGSTQLAERLNILFSIAPVLEHLTWTCVLPFHDDIPTDVYPILSGMKSICLELPVMLGQSEMAAQWLLNTFQLLEGSPTPRLEVVRIIFGGRKPEIENETEWLDALLNYPLLSTVDINFLNVEDREGDVIDWEIRLHALRSKGVKINVCKITTEDLEVLQC